VTQAIATLAAKKEDNTSAHRKKANAQRPDSSGASVPASGK
jgi:hypothetical protein